MLHGRRRAVACVFAGACTRALVMSGGAALAAVGWAPVGVSLAPRDRYGQRYRHGQLG